MSLGIGLLRCVGKGLVKALGNAVGFGIAGDLVVEMADEIWRYWDRLGEGADRGEAVATLPRPDDEDFRHDVSRVVDEVAGDQPEPVRQAVTTYLTQLPEAIRATLGTADHAGESRLRQPGDLVPVLTAGLRALAPTVRAQFRWEGRRPGPVHALSFSPDARHLYAGCDDGAVYRTDAGTGADAGRWAGHSGAVTGLAITGDARWLVSGGEDQTVRLWGLPEGRPVTTIATGVGQVRCVAAGTNRQLLAGGGWFDEFGEPRRCGVRVWDAAGGRQVAELSTGEHPVLCAAFVGEGRRVLTGGWDQQLRLWQVDSGHGLQSYAKHDGPVWCLAVAGDGRRALSGSTDGVVRVWDLASGRERGRLTGHEGWVRGLAFAPDGRLALSGGEDRTVRLWDLLSGQNVWEGTGHRDDVLTVAFGPDGKCVASGDRSGAVRLWELQG